MMQRASQKFRVVSLLYLLNILILYNVTSLRMAAGSPAVDFGSPPSCNQTCDYVEFGKNAYCNSRNLTVVPQSCSLSIFLDMRGNDIHELRPGVFQHFTALRYLDLSQNSIERLHKGTFAGALQLQEIYMFKNGQINIHHDAFAGAESIQSIYLSRNAIQALPHTALRGLPHLEVLFMSHNHLCYLNRHQFLHNRRLTHLGFSYNQLELILPETFRHLTKLEYLDLSFNNLHVIQGGTFGNLGVLQTLMVTNNSLGSEVITYELLSSPKLEVLDLTSNMIETVPPGLALSALGKLRLAENPLSCNCTLRDLQTLYRAKIGDDVSDEDREDWIWAEDVTCETGEALISTTIECPEPTTTAPILGTRYSPLGVPNTHSEKNTQEHSSFLTPVVAVAIIVSFICVIICIYVAVCWVKACYKEHQYRKNGSKSLSLHVEMSEPCIKNP